MRAVDVHPEAIALRFWKYVENYPAERAMYERELDAIHALYQSLGTRSGAYAELDRQAYAFLQREVLQLVTLGATPQASKEAPK